MMKHWILFGLAVALTSTSETEQLPLVKVGSKNFTEGYILSEIISQTIEDSGLAQVKRKFGLGNTGIVYAALIDRSIDLYPEYTGTISNNMIKDAKISSIQGINKKLIPIGLQISESIGFNNTYALAMYPQEADQRGITKISDLNQHLDLRLGLSHEFLDRADGWPALSRAYRFKLERTRGMEHALAYRALEEGSVDLIDVYSTDGQISKMDLRILEDDYRFFPQYEAVLLANSKFSNAHPELWQLLNRKLKGSLTEARMSELNAMVDTDKKTFAEVAQFFLNKQIEVESELTRRLKELLRLTIEHFYLVAGSVIAAILVGLPLGVLASRSPLLGQTVLVVSGLLQTIPSLALLCFLIPVFGIGTLPSLVALFLYALLPVVRGTYSGLQSLDHRLLQVGIAMGLTPWQRLRLLEIPMASISIMSGIKTSAIINVGTATLAAFIGAGGYGRLIVSGLALNDNTTILWGAVPAALMAIGVHFLFEASDRIFVPKGLRLKQEQI